MTIRIPLSHSGPADVFATTVEAHRADLVAHRSGKAGVPVPFVSPLIDSVIARVPRGDPYPDDFVVLPYEIVDDGPTLADRKGQLNTALGIARADTIAAILSPARAQLLALDMAEAIGTPEESRTPAQTACIAAYVAFHDRVTEITRNAALAAIEIEELPDAAACDAWKVLLL